MNYDGQYSCLNIKPLANPPPPQKNEEYKHINSR